MIAKIAIKIKREMKDISSDSHDSILRDTVEAVKHFHWETVMLELLKKMPTLMALLSHLIPKPTERKPMHAMLLGFTTSKGKTSSHGFSSESSIYYDVWKWHCQAGKYMTA